MLILVFTLKISTIIKLYLIVSILGDITKGQQNRVSSKLDFDDNNDEYIKTNNTTIQISPNDANTSRREDKQFNKNEMTHNKEDTTTKRTVNSGPKIHGVRVTLDTGDSTKEFKESAEIPDLGKNKKRVGIRTDITFEITGVDEGSTNINKTNTENDSEDDIIPIFKGHRQKSGKPQDSKKNHHVQPEHKIYDNSGHGGRNIYDYYPEYYQQDKPNYMGQSSIQSGGGTTGYSQNRQGWISYVPRSWTTERSYPYRSNSVTGYRETYWKPCYCITSNMNHRLLRRNSYSQHQHQHQQQHHQADVIIKPTSSLIEIVDGKLEMPFSKK